MRQRLERLLHPRSIAVIGGREAARVIEQCDRIGFSGDIWPVHPERNELAGRRCVRSVADLPDAPDAAFIAVNRRLTIDAVKTLVNANAGGAICYASGFREAEDGADLQAALVDAAGAMPLIGPNCYGILNYLDRIALWPDQHGGKPTDSGVAIVTQSSNIAINITMQRRGLPIAYVVTAGNQAQTGLSDIALALMEDPRVTAIGLHIEAIDDVARFAALSLHARQLKKPVVALTVGLSEQSRAATVSHTASLAGSGVAMSAFFRRLGIPRVKSIPELLEALKLLHVHGSLAGGELCSMSCSGGEAALAADSALGRSIRFRTLNAAEAARVKGTLNPMVAVANPLDYHTFAWGNEEAMAATFSAMTGCGFDLSLLVLDFPRIDRCDDADWEAAVNALDRASRACGARSAVVATLPENLSEDRAGSLIARGIAPLCGLDDALAAAEAAASIGRAWAQPLPPKPFGLSCAGADPSLLTLSEVEAKRLLSGYGVKVPESQVVATPEEAVVAAEALGFPVVLKAVGMAHKSDVGGVRLGLEDASSVRVAACELGRVSPILLVETMITDGVAELLVGVVRDPQFGFLMTLAVGGILVELLEDSCSILLPVTASEVREAILSLKLAPLLTGYRGRIVADLDAAVAAALAVARFVEDHAEEVEELDVNPLIVRPNGEGAVAVDALIRMREGR